MFSFYELRMYIVKQTSPRYLHHKALSIFKVNSDNRLVEMKPEHLVCIHVDR